MPDNEKIAYTRKQAAAALQVGLPILDRWMYRDERPIPHIRQGRRILIPVAALAARPRII